MSLGSRAVLLLTFALVACSGESKKLPRDPSDDDAGGALTPGDRIDTDADGTPDGTAVDSDGDGVVDGVQLDNDAGLLAVVDGVVQQPPANGGGDGGTGIPTDSGIPQVFPVDKNGDVLCGTAPCACNDGVDNDNDGLTDSQDPECVSPWDNDESSFGTGISGDNRDEACQDCFFDGNSGSGDDRCRLPTSCLTEGTASGSGNCKSCEQPKECLDFCKAYTPNGCDCFGCCEVRLADNTVKNFLLTAECKITGSTATGCTACVPNKNCVNTCGECELCPGKTLQDLDPVKCASMTPPDGDAGTLPPPEPSCEGGGQRCGSGLPTCGAASTCTFGCCVLLPAILL